MASTKLQNAANLATVFAAIVAAGAFYYGYRQFRETQQATRETLALQGKSFEQEQESFEQERESQAVELFIKYNELMKERPSNLKSGGKAAKFWRDNLALSITESIYKLRSQDEGWRKTVEWMLSNHTEFIKTERLNCKTYNPEFIEFVKQLVGSDICIST